MLPLQRGEKPCDDCEWVDGWPHCTMNCSGVTVMLRRQDPAGYEQPRLLGSGRVADNPQETSLIFDRELTDNELRALHEHLRKFHYHHPWEDTNG